MDTYSSFFANMASRFRNENDLSDITWAMCQASPCFKEKWIHFFFPDLNLDDIDYFEREVPDGQDFGSRVDFLVSLKNDSSPFLIEVKIWDQNHHFGQYEVAYNVDSTRLGYITNYFLKQEGYTIKQWNQFYDTLIRSIKNNEIQEEEAGLIAGYCEYLKNVCNIYMITETINIDKMTSLFDLTVISREAAEYSSEYFDVKNWSTTHRDDLRWLFLEVNYKYPEEWGKQYPFIGIIYRHPSPYICAGFDCRKGWARGIVDFMKKNHNLLSKIESTYCLRPELDGDYYFKMSDYALKEFQRAQSLDRQKTILRAFLNEVLMFPIHLYRIVHKV